MTQGGAKAKRGASMARGIGCGTAIGLLLVAVGDWAWGEITSGPQPAATRPATPASPASSAAVTACSGWHWPRPVPGKAIEQNLLSAEDGVLRCFSVGTGRLADGCHGRLFRGGSASEPVLVDELLGSLE
jgi:hypothetical protein